MRKGSLLISLFVASNLQAADLGTDSERAEGKKLYDHYCTQCHGEQGAGDGPGKIFFNPRPRDFTSAKYKMRSTSSGSLPMDGDIVKAIRHGLAFQPGMAYTGMPPWPQFTDQQIENIVYHLKTFSADFSDPAYNDPKPIALPAAPPYSEESAEKGRTFFETNECIKCHGDLGRGDGRSAPTLKDDWGEHIKPADLRKRWTFRAGASREDIFRTISTGFNGTPMPSYADTISENDRWDLVNYIYSLSERSAPQYNQSDSPILISFTEKSLKFTDIEMAKTAFADSKTAYIPVAGQVIEPGRGFYPSINEIEVNALYNSEDIAVMLRWHDMQADKSGKNGYDIQVTDPDPANKDKPKKANEDPFAETDPFAEDEQSKEEFSDAVSVQIPSVMPVNFEKPYFLVGSSKNSVQIWFADLAQSAAQKLIGKGSSSVTLAAENDIQVISNYNHGEWEVIFTRPRNAKDSLSFMQEGVFIPVAFSVWDGFAEERGSKRGLTSWYQFYIQPSAKESPFKKMIIYAAALLALELLLIGFIRKRNAK